MTTNPVPAGITEKHFRYMTNHQVLCPPMSSVLMVLADDHEEQADQEGELKEPNEEEQEEDRQQETKEGRSTRLFKTLFEQTKDDIFWNPPLYSGKYVGLGVGVADTAFFKKMNISIE